MKVELSPKTRKYLRRIARRLRFPNDIKNRICTDLQTTILIKLESGAPEDAILRELGSPKAVADEFHSQMADLIRSKSPVRFFCLAAGILSALVLMGKLALRFYLNDLINGMTRSIGIIGGADGPTSIFVTTAVSNGLDWGTVIWTIILIGGFAGFFILNSRSHKEDSE